MNWKLSNILVGLFIIPGYFLFKIPIMGKYLVRILPFAFRMTEKNMSFKKIFELSLLDTFDNLSPIYDNPLTYKMLHKTLTKNEFLNIERRDTPGLSISCNKS